MNRLPRAAADERGSILILATVGIVVAMIAAALAVDLGRLASDKRDDQKIADLAALDAARNLSSAAAACSAAQASAARNGYNSLSCAAVVLGHVDSLTKVFSAGGANDAVQVSVRSNFSTAFPFVGGPSSTGGKAVAAVKSQAGFSIGSSLGNFSSADNVVLNKVLGKLFNNPGAVSLSAVTYQGLAGSTIKLGDLAAQLGFGSVDTMLTSTVTLGQLLTATGTVLSNSNTILGASVTGLASLVLSGTSSFKLGDIITAQQGSGVAASTGINVLDLITGSAELANKSHLVDVGTSMTLPVTGVGSLATKLSLTVIEAAQTYIGPVGGSVKTAQVSETLTPNLNANALGLGLLTVSGDIPVALTSAGATGTLNSITCTSPQGIGVGVSATPVTTSVSTTLTVSSLGIPVASVKVGPASADSASATNSVSFSYPAEFTPTASPKSTPAVPPGLALTGGQISVTLLGLLPLGITASNIAAAVLGIVNNTVTAVSNQVLSPTFAAMGLKLGQVDVAALKDAFNPATCGQPGLMS
jgi:uncharacterized membrane protein